MSVLTGKFQEERVVGYRCNKCSMEATFEDSPLEAQEFLNWNGHAGYGSVFGDGNELSLTLCQHCTKELVGRYVWSQAE